MKTDHVELRNFEQIHGNHVLSELARRKQQTTQHMYSHIK